MLRYIQTEYDLHNVSHSGAIYNSQTLLEEQTSSYLGWLTPPKINLSNAYSFSLPFNPICIVCLKMFSGSPAFMRKKLNSPWHSRLSETWLSTNFHFSLTHEYIPSTWQKGAIRLLQTSSVFPPLWRVPWYSYLVFKIFLSTLNDIGIDICLSLLSLPN